MLVPPAALILQAPFHYTSIGRSSHHRRCCSDKTSHPASRYQRFPNYKSTLGHGQVEVSIRTLVPHRML